MHKNTEMHKLFLISYALVICVTGGRALGFPQQRAKTRQLNPKNSQRFIIIMFSLE